MFVCSRIWNFVILKMMLSKASMNKVLRKEGNVYNEIKGYNQFRSWNIKTYAQTQMCGGWYVYIELFIQLVSLIVGVAKGSHSLRAGWWPLVNYWQEGNDSPLFR